MSQIVLSTQKGLINSTMIFSVALTFSSFELNSSKLWYVSEGGEDLQLELFLVFVFITYNFKIIYEIILGLYIGHQNASYLATANILWTVTNNH